MNTMKWLLRREMWENKGSLFWTPVIIGAVMLVLVTATAAWGLLSGQFGEGGVYVNGRQVDAIHTFAALDAGQRREFAAALTGSYLVSAAPLLLALSVVVFFYCLGALHDERRDRSILFWKSLPLSDQSTVLSKVATALVVAPLIVLAVAIATSVTVLLLFALLLALKGQNLFGLLLTTPGLYLAPLQLVSLLPIYVLWALPTVGWLLMVSSWARGKVFLWAVGTPLLLGALLKWASMITGVNLNAEWYMQNIVMRGLGSLLPTWLADGRVPHHTLINEGEHTIDMGNVVLHSYLTLTHVEMWIGAAAGAAMIYAAIRLRRWKDEG